MSEPLPPSGGVRGLSGVSTDEDDEADSVPGGGSRMNSR